MLNFLSKKIYVTCALYALLALGLIAFNSCSSTKKVATTKPDKIYKPLSKDELKAKYAGKMNVDKSDVKNISLYTFIDEWYGAPYVYGGNTKKGVDCSGFVCQLYTTVIDTKVPRTSQQQFDATKRIKKVAKLDEGDLVFFNGRGKNVSHVGVYLQNKYFVHASTSGGVMISNLEDDYWKKHFIAGGKL